MSSVVIYAGTTEGYKLAKILADSGIKCDVCVATEYGSHLAAGNDNICVHSGRLDADGMRKLYAESGCELVVDATHPYATEVTRTVRDSVSDTAIEYMRLLRPSCEASDGVLYYDSAAECAKALTSVEGNILLTTGSKELGVFCADQALRDRLTVRVIPGIESISICNDNGIAPGRIVAAQGPFTEEENIALIHRYNISHLVTKESGITGGEDTKLSAAYKTHTTVHMIRRPDDTEGYSFAEIISVLEDRLGIALRHGKVNVSLIGIGCGSRTDMTVEASETIARSDYIFGAPRMLETVMTGAVRYPYYLKDDIVPVLDEICKDRYDDCIISVLFSGDTGFCSGAGALYDALKDRDDITVSILPGISSISMLSARTGISWNDAKLISTHGADPDEWMFKMYQAVRLHRKVFFITSGVEDIHRIGTVMECVGTDNLKAYIGYRLSYSDEWVRILDAGECRELKDDGLYAGCITNDTPDERPAMRVISDDDFIRDKTPMTKEDIRTLSIARLRLCAGSVMYDIGAGTGSVSVQAAALSPEIQVYAIEKDRDALDLIRRNREKFMTDNVRIVEGEAPGCLGDMPAADCAFIGGSGGKPDEILARLHDINPHMRIVMNAVTLESISRMHELARMYSDGEPDIVQVSVDRVCRLGEHDMLRPNTPVFIFAFDMR